MNIVILGYSGMIGENVLKNLLKNTNANIFCVGKKNNKRIYHSNRIKYYDLNFINFKQSELFFLKRADIVINCAGKIKSDRKNLNYINFVFIKKLTKYIINHQLKIRFIHLSSISVYNGSKLYWDKQKIITEKTATNACDIYSKSKLNADKYINFLIKKKTNQNLSFTILRVSNVYGKEKNSNLYNFLLFFLKIGFWFKVSDKSIFNFINIKDVSQAIKLVIFKLKRSKNKVYILADDCRQTDFLKFYEKNNNKNIKKIFISENIINFLMRNVPLPKKLLNFILLISSKVTYSNKKIIKELNFKPKFSFKKLQA